MTIEEPVDTTDALVATYVALEAMGNLALNDLNAAGTRAQQILSDIEARVALGQMGAELVPLLTTAIQEAKQTHADLQASVTDVQQQREALEESIETSVVIEVSMTEPSEESNG